MPYNSLSNISTSIFPIDHPTLPRGLPSQEYKHYSAQSASGTIQEVVTIESNVGTSFEIRVDIEPGSYSMLRPHPDDAAHGQPEYDYLIYVVLDGLHVQRSKRHRSQQGPTRISGVYSPDRTHSRSFQFGKLALVDADDDSLDADARQKLAAELCDDDAVLASLGTIEINIVRCQLGKSRPVASRPAHAPSHSSADLRTTNQMKFSERSKKACLSSTVGLSDARPSASAEAYGAKRNVKPVLWEDPNPFLQFVFKYKSRALLEAEGIIAPPPPPPPAPPADVPPTLPEPEPRKPKLKQDPGPQPSVCGCQASLRPAPSVDDKKPKREYVEIESDDEAKVAPTSGPGSSFQSPSKPAGDAKEGLKCEPTGEVKCEGGIKREGVSGVKRERAASVKREKAATVLDVDASDEEPAEDVQTGVRKRRSKSRKTSNNGPVVIDLTGGDGSDSD